MSLDFIAGFLGGCAGVIVGHPLDTVKVKIQTQDFRNPQYKGTFHCLSSIIKNESAAALYKGMSSPMAGVAVVNALVFGVYGGVQRMMPDPNSLSSVFIAGTTAGLVQSVICSPMELVKTRIQIQKTQIFKNPFQCLKHVYKTNGLRGVFQGLSITALREGPGFGSYFLAYELMTRSDEPISTPHMLFAGGMAGSLSWLFAYPVDVIKSRIQVDGMSDSRRYKNSLDCYRKSVAAEGFGCLFRGLNTTLIRAFPVNAATWAVVTWTFRFCQTENKDTDTQTVTQYVEKAKFKDIDLQKSYLFNLYSYDVIFSTIDVTQKYYVPKFNKQNIEKTLYQCRQDLEQWNVIRKKNVNNMVDTMALKTDKEVPFESFVDQVWNVERMLF